MLDIWIGLNSKRDYCIGVSPMATQSNAGVRWSTVDRVLCDQIYDLREVVAKDQSSRFASVARLSFGQLLAIRLQIAQAPYLLRGGAYILPATTLPTQQDESAARPKQNLVAPIKAFGKRKKRVWRALAKQHAKFRPALTDEAVYAQEEVVQDGTPGVERIKWRSSSTHEGGVEKSTARPLATY